MVSFLVMITNVSDYPILFFTRVDFLLVNGKKPANNWRKNGDDHGR